MIIVKIVFERNLSLRYLIVGIYIFISQLFIVCKITLSLDSNVLEVIAMKWGGSLLNRILFKQLISNVNRRCYIKSLFLSTQEIPILVIIT